MRHISLVAGVVALALHLVIAIPAGATIGPMAQDTPGSLSQTGTDQISTADVTPTQTDPAENDSTLADPNEDVLGWEDGYWYNESVSVDQSDGLNESELAAVVSRSMARVEEVRGLEFQDRVPVDIISRDEYQTDNAARFENTSDRFRVHQNTKFEALFFVNESTDAVAVQESTRGATVLGFYSPSDDQITIVSENTTSPRMDEITLSQELFHALQGQVFNAYEQEYYPGTTREENNAINGLIEGDGNYVDQLYQERCEADWDCLLPQNTGGGGGGDVNIGINVLNLPGYTEGPEFVQQLYEQDGWEAVNDLYDQPPASTEQYIDTSSYPDEAPADFSVDDRSADDWEVLELEGNDSVNYAEFGQAGLFTMLWYATYEETVATQTRATVGDLSYSDLFETNQQGEIKDIGGYNYSHPAVSGFAGDRLLPYVPDQNASRSEAGYVWELRWDTPDDAQAFRTSYQELLEYRGATEVDQREETYRIPDEAGFGDAFYLTQQDNTVTIVNAPTVDDLSGIFEGAAPESTAGTAGDNGTENTDETDETENTDETATNDADDGGPGFTIGLGLIALIAAILVAVRRRN
ncbi:MAG: PGF-CTERM archaeal protein-sorting signal [halophilic archaeon J07HX5]|jgi:hypothetical protein|nr:MAG: PGF-CTERM archaeal protein-sorting signal [halophilic archaeon J07HX5]